MTGAAAPAAPTRRGPTVAALYALFAALSTVVNLCVQSALFGLTDSLLLPLAAGTAASLPVKYFLDKKYIFRFRSAGVAHDGLLLFLYSCMSVVTTGVFWGAEWLTRHLTDDYALTLAGGAVGLAIGYVVKYQLDVRFVFVSRDIPFPTPPR